MTLLNRTDKANHPMTPFRYRRPSLNSVLGILKKRVKKELEITSARTPFGGGRMWNGGSSKTLTSGEASDFRLCATEDPINGHLSQ